MIKGEIAAFLPNIRSSHNVGSIFRTSDALGISKIFLAGYTPCPVDRFQRVQKEIAKTALGAEKNIPWEYIKDIPGCFKKLKKEGYLVVGIEQDGKSIDYKKFKLNKVLKESGYTKVVFVVGNEVDGLSQKEKSFCDYIVEIPMKGEKESMNVVVSFGIAVSRILNV
ncbi:MAG: RNA methyltransferase [Candidatus Taylorbacteria bacterium]|nr:RNA methyltransferase [Candidatus Taylorbacteria bacterium]